MTAEPPGWSRPDDQPAPGPPSFDKPQPGPPPAPGWSPAQPPPAPGWSGPPQPGAPHPGWAGWVAHRPPEVKPGVVPLRPLGVGEILDGAISTMRRHWKVQLGLSAAVVTVVSILQFTVLYFVFQDSALTGSTTFGEPGEEIDAATNVAQIVSAVVGLLAQIVVQGILTVVVSRAVLGQDVTMAEAWARAKPRLGKLVLMSVAILATVAVLVIVPVVLGFVVGAGAGTEAGFAVGGIGLVCTLPLAVWIYVSLGVSAPVMMLEETGIRAAFARSRKLVRGTWWRVFGILLLGMVIAQVLGGIIQVPFALGSYFTAFSEGEAPGVWFYVLNVIGSSLAGMITYPFVAGVVALVYVDLRIRREGLDLALSRAAGVPSAPTQQYPPTQYPPYPPQQYPPAQYPPAQYPQAQYPPNYYPPPGGQPPYPPPPPRYEPGAP